MGATREPHIQLHGGSSNNRQGCKNNSFRRQSRALAVSMEEAEEAAEEGGEASTEEAAKAAAKAMECSSHGVIKP